MLMLIPVVLGVTLLVVVLELSGVVLARHQAEAAADLAALAAAGRGGGSVAPACSVAARVAGLNGGELTGCEVEADGSVVVKVQVRIRVGGFGAGLGPARGEARAGVCPSC